MPAVALSRVVESGPGGEDLAASAWQRLEALPDPRSPRGRIYPLACLVAIAVCAFTAAWNDRFIAIGQWIRRASQQDLARLRAPWDPMAGRYRVPDEKTVRVVLDRLDPRALARALLGGRPDSRRGRGGRPAASVRGYCARQAIKITRWRQDTATGKASRQTVYAVSSLTSAHAAAQDLGRLVREHWSIEAHHQVRSPGVTGGVA